MGASSSTERRTRNVALEETSHLEEVAFMPGKTLLGGTSPLKGAKSHTSPEHSQDLSESATTVGSATTAAYTAGDVTTTAARSGRSVPCLFPQEETEGCPPDDSSVSLNLKKELAATAPASKPKKTVSLPSTPSRSRPMAQGPPLLPIRARQQPEEEDEQAQPDKSSRSRSLFLPIQPRRSYCCGTGHVSSPTPKQENGENMQPQGSATPEITKSKSAPLLLPLRSRQEAAQAEAAGMKTPIPMGTGRNSDHTPEMVKEVRSPSTALSAARRKSRRTVTFEGEQVVCFKVERAEDSSPESDSANVSAC